MSISSALIALSVALALSLTQVDQSAIQRMAATERAFAAAAAEIGVRDSFLTFFADDAVSVRAGKDGPGATVVPAKDGLRAAPLEPLPLARRLLWEPFTGHISSDGTFGWLTGGYAMIALATKDLVGKGAYFSVWKKQSDGTWRVWLDEGISLPNVWQDASPFRKAPEPDTGSAGQPNETLADAEKSVAAGGDTWRQRLAEGVRIHRNARMPLVGRDAAGEWARETWRKVTFTVVRIEQASSNDLAVAIGGYDAVGADETPQHGTWVRMWKRDVPGRWRIVFETSKGAQ